eukprot:CAMPEP_0119524702 /NCGR_PEP_ID=MMETSP1344-20130328/39609_1 /TAXON_ID=236787 /ORGANISM="Florenciella parvula, Strain CCMP2471" /LENGTH=81 /DNA_ID=CAMNT_0007563281 /DNA_START=118 /DNA_END=363 /DNA_ORIENTATION=+
MQPSRSVDYKIVMLAVDGRLAFEPVEGLVAVELDRINPALPSVSHIIHAAALPHLLHARLEQALRLLLPVAVLTSARDAVL